jgi:cytochrome c biogenesis protein ResB
MAETPFRAKLADGEWVFELKRRSYPLPFEIRLDKFIHEQHPGTSIAKAFISDVTRTEAGASQTARISMNAPMRHKGYAFYQSSWGGGDNQAKYSVLSVVKNPADKFPQYACTVVAAGLFIHFCLRLIAYLRKQNRERVS